jgi:hypothetical protein
VWDQVSHPHKTGRTFIHTACFNLDFMLFSWYNLQLVIDITKTHVHTHVCVCVCVCVCITTLWKRSGLVCYIQLITTDIGLAFKPLLLRALCSLCHNNCYMLSSISYGYWGCVHQTQGPRYRKIYGFLNWKESIGSYNSYHGDATNSH